jgi:hypothetical protein
LLAIIMGIVGAVLSGVGLSAAGRLQSGKGMAIAGLVLSILAVIWGPVWFFIYFYAATRTLQQAVQQAAANPKAFQFQVNNPQGPPTPATGKVTLANGQATLQGNLAPNDPKDRVQVLSACKVYTIAMAAGKTYQIDLIRSDNGIDPFLRLEDAAGTNLAQDDDSGGNLNSRIIFPCTQAGEYRIIATSLIGGTGNFTLQVSEK